jgi:hypothetical protein
VVNLNNLNGFVGRNPLAAEQLKNQSLDDYITWAAAQGNVSKFIEHSALWTERIITECGLVSGSDHPVKDVLELKRLLG